MPQTAPRYLQRPDNEMLAYVHIGGKSPGVVFCPGFHSNMEGDKALALDRWCRATGRQFTRFDYFGHGHSSGQIADGTIGRWREDALAVLDEVTSGPQLIVGSSMGGWMMLLIALARPERVSALVGIACAADMTRDMPERRLTAEQRKLLDDRGWVEIANSYDDGAPYRLRREMLSESKAHWLLDGDIPIQVPVRLIHGLADLDVPWQRSVAVAERLESNDVEVILVKDGDHRLSTTVAIDRLQNILAGLLEPGCGR